MAELEVAHIDGIPTSGLDLRTGYAGLQAGVWGAGDLKVTQRAAGTDRSVDVAAGVVWMPSFIGLEDLYRGRNDAVKNSAAFNLGGIPAPNASFDRLDQIIARTYDDTVSGGGSGKLWQLEVLPGGIPTQNATLANRHNAAALPAGSVRLADVVTPTTGVITNAQIRDRRPWARGAYRDILRTANAAGANDYTTTTVSPGAALDATNLSPRIECSGGPVRVALKGEYGHSVPGPVNLQLMSDGVPVNGDTNGRVCRPPTTGDNNLEISWVFTPAVGSHVIAPWWWVQSGTGTIYVRAAIPLTMTVEEAVRSSADNS